AIALPYGAVIPWWKRAFDLTVAVVLLVLLSPLLLVIAAYIRTASPGPALFFQQRVGAMGETFWIWKFRSMRTDTDQSRHAAHLLEVSQSGSTPSKLDTSRDLIPGGAWLRRCSLDELPQLVNVLRGEMSIVGPRPDVLEPHHYDAWALERFQVTPGVTGLWQVSGKNSSTWEEMLRLDVTYAQRRSPWLDAQILLRTIPLLFGGNSS
ncbi:MAG: sugar transferase, partial [Planctomycetales bacterium]|nr:sugar transferase [Planctomycetales bacterium]